MSTPDKTTNVRIEHELEFRALGGSPLRLRVDMLQVTDHVMLRAHLAWSDWATVLDHGLFHLGSPPADIPFENDSSLMIEARLRDGLAERWLSEPVGLAAEIFDSSSPLRSTEAWHAIEVLQSVSIPGMDDDVRSQIGFRTQVEEPPPPTADQLLRELLAERNWVYTDLGPTSLRYRVDLGNGAAWIVGCVLDPEQDVCRLFAIHPRLIAEDGRAEACAWLTFLNNELTDGALVMDPDDGEISYRISAPAHRAALDRALDLSVSVMGHVFREVSRRAGAE